MKRVAAYARVSADDQSLEPQLLALRDYATRVGVAALEFTDHAVSGRRERRPGLDALLRACRRREVDAVAVVRLDRLGRSLTHLLQILGELDALGVAVIGLDDAIDTRTPTGRLFMQIRGAFAEYEVALIRERTRAGLEAARRRGTRLGRPPVVAGEALQRAKRMHGAGMSLRHIAKVLGVSRFAVTRALASR